jgi:endonuclease/exonuclease/phosphatase family metal-dependent hydrolase
VVWTWLIISKPAFLETITPQILLVWNAIFTISLTGTILVHRVAFPLTPESSPVVIGNPTWLGQLPLLLMLLSFPVIFLDLRIFLSALQAESPSPRQLVPAMLLGSLALVLLVFISIFTNVWGYVEPVSTPFRNQFHLPYLLITGILTLLIGRTKPTVSTSQSMNTPPPIGWSMVLATIFLATVLFSLRTEKIQPAETNKNSLVVMTYNIQQANDDFGERSADEQLALIRQVSPDILALQESDSARISLNNNDYVLYYASKLGYHSYYGPTTVTGTFGTAILSKYPLENPRTVFTFSDVDEIGTTEAEITVGGRVFSIYNVHPDGTDTAMLVFAERLLERTQGKANVIILGDFNLRDNEQPFQLIAEQYTNAWTSVYPSKISTDGTDMSGRNRIDHIFFSPELTAQNPVYVLPPESATDHPVHWAEIYWK